MIKEECDLKVTNKESKNKCRAICLKHFDERCCQECSEINVCKRICGWMKLRLKND